MPDNQGRLTPATGISILALQAQAAALLATAVDLQAQIDALQDAVSGATVNLIANPTVEVHATGYEGTGSGTFVRSNAAGVAFDGSYGLDVTTINADASGIKYTSDVGTPGIDKVFSIYARLQSAGSHAMIFYIDWYDIDDVFLSEDTATFTLNSTVYDRFWVTAPAPADASYAQLYVVTDGAVGVFHYFTDGWQFEDGTVPTALNVGSDLEGRVAVLEAMIEPGDDTGVFHLGPSSKGNATVEARYDRTVDALYAGGQVIVETAFDTPTILVARKEVPTDNQTVRRDDAVPRRSSDGADVFNNGSDGASSAIAHRWHVPGGTSPQTSHSTIEMQVVNELENGLTKPPRTALRVSGENGNEIWMTNYDSSGAVVTDIQLFPRPDVFGA